MARGDLTDQEWQRLEPLLPPQKSAEAGGQYRDHRQVINGILWVLRTGAPWRDLPGRYGPWGTCYSRFRRWSEQGIWESVLEHLQAQEDAAGGLDWREAALDSSTIKAHPHAAGAPKKGGLPHRTLRQPKSSGGVGAA
jgi:transposase